MSTAVLALALTLGAVPAPAKPPAHGDGVSPEEKAFCASELEVIERRTSVFEAQGLKPAEIDRRNDGPRQNLADCHRRFVADQRRLADEQEDLAEMDRRAGANATELERERIWRQLRRERLASKSPAALTPEEKAELQAGVADELAASHDALDTAHARDPFFMRQVHSALACYHGRRRDELRAELGHEDTLVKVGGGDRTRLYALRAELKQSEDVLARSREAARGLPDGLARCTEPQTAVLAHCLEVRFEEKPAEPACDSEEIQQYVRFIK
jgi:hypothetical protein